MSKVLSHVLLAQAVHSGAHVLRLDSRPVDISVALAVQTASASTAVVIMSVHAAFLEVVKVLVYTRFIAENVRHTTSAGRAVIIRFTSA